MQLVKKYKNIKENRVAAKYDELDSRIMKKKWSMHGLDPHRK